MLLIFAEPSCVLLYTSIQLTFINQANETRNHRLFFPFPIRIRRPFAVGLFIKNRERLPEPGLLHALPQTGDEAYPK
jgi:hypothetical protein